MTLFIGTLTVGCAISVSTVFSIKASSTQDLTEIAESQLGVTEQPIGSNWGPEVKDYLASTGISFPAPWCAAFVQWCLNRVGQKGYGAYVPSWDKKELRIETPKRNDLGLVWFSSMKRYAHIYIVTGRPSPRSVSTIEGNTNNGGSRDGIGVFKRIRPLDGQRFVRPTNG